MIRPAWNARITALALCAMTALGAACAGEPGPTGWTVAVDTVGGTVRVTNTPPATDPGPTLVGIEELRVGARDGGGPTSFGRLREVALLGDGRFAVADAQAEEVRVFDAGGQHLRTFGGEGAGPGELRGMQGVHVGPDGLLRVAEQANARLSVFHPDSGFVRSFPLRLHSYGFGGPWAAAVDSAGRTLVASSGQFGEGRFWNMLRVYDRSMTQIDSIPYHDYTDDTTSDEDPPGAWKIPVGNRGWMYAPVPFHSSPHEALSPTGEFWTSTSGATQLEVARWNPRGDTSLVLTALRPAQPVTAVERDSALAEVADRLAPRVPSLPRLDPGRVPPTKPPLYGLSLDNRGRLWVRLTEPAADSTSYDVFGPDGAYVETVALPFRVDRAIPPVPSGDELWAVVTDDVDVQYVVRARLSRPVES